MTGAADAHRLVAACCESIEFAAALLDAEPHLLCARTALGETALHFLVVENRIDLVHWLHARGASLDTVSELAISPLAEAAYLGHEGLVAWLLDNGAALDVAGQSAPVLVGAADSGNACIVRRLVAAGADVTAADRFGRTALHVASRDDAALAVVETLLAAGASPHASLADGRSVLDVATQAGALRISALLRTHGARTGVLR